MSIEIILVNCPFLCVITGLRAFWDVRKDDDRLPRVEGQRRTSTHDRSVVQLKLILYDVQNNRVRGVCKCGHSGNLRV